MTYGSSIRGALSTRSPWGRIDFGPPPSYRWTVSGGSGAQPSGETGDGILDLARHAVALARESPGGRPLVTLAWAQTLNGIIARRPGERTELSGPQSMALTHALRSLHRGILVGIGTVLADDPLLSVRLVEGPQPRPVVLDSRLRTPPSSRLLARTDMKPWIFHAQTLPGAGDALERAGARLFRVRRLASGLDLEAVLDILIRGGLGSVMVEGGAAVIRAFLAGGLAQHAMVTVSPELSEGLPVIAEQGGLRERVTLREPVYEVHGRDVLVWGELRR